ncbi:MAG: citrate/2-methylcitrate synthase [Parachlamydiaceae bacterium]
MQKAEKSTLKALLSDHLLKLILGKHPSHDEVSHLNTSLILYAEHEFSTSTFVV